MVYKSWRKYKLGDVLEIKYGKDHKLLTDGNIPAYGSGGIMRFVNKFLYNKPSILIPRKGSLNNIIYVDWPFWTVDTMFWTKVNLDLVNPKFLYYQLTKIDFVSLNVGSAVPSLTVPVVNDIDVFLPSIDVQNRIELVLSTLDNKIEINNKINESIEEIAITIFKERLININYPNAKLDKEHNRLSENLPINWKKGTFGDIVVQTKASINPSLFPERKFDHYSLPAFDLSEIPSSDFGGTILSNKNIVKKYSVLISKLNPRIPRIWSIGDIDENFSICSTEFIGFVPKQSYYYSFMNYFLKQSELVNILSGIATGTSNSHQRIRPIDLLELECVLPDDATVKTFNKIVKPLLEKRFKNIQENQVLRNLRNVLLPKLMKGEF